MGISVPIEMRIDTRALNTVLARKLELAGKTARGAQDIEANRACEFISMRAAQRMPRVSPWAIDQELEVSAHGVTQTGALSKAKKPRRVQVGSHPSSLASWIVLASFYSTSRYNITTGQVWKRGKPATRGADEFWTWIAATAARMVKTRHSAAGFFYAVARAVNVGFGMALGKFRGVDAAAVASGKMDVNETSKLLSRGLARVTPATGGNGHASFSVATTEPDTKGQQGRALREVAQPVWQAAVDEATENVKRSLEKRYGTAFAAGGIEVS